MCDIRSVVWECSDRKRKMVMPGLESPCESEPRNGVRRPSVLGGKLLLLLLATQCLVRPALGLRRALWKEAPAEEWHRHVDTHWEGRADIRNHREMRERFNEVYHRVKRHNREYLEGKHTYYLTHNVRHASLLAQTIVKQNGLKPTRFSAAMATSFRSTGGQYQSLAATANATVDWVVKGKVQAVKDQGSCGSCWAFATASAVETATAIATAKAPPNLAEQQLVDCEIPDSLNMGSCSGGNPANAVQYSIDNGLTVQPTYPYVSGETADQNPYCNTTAVASKQASVSRLELVPPQDEKSLIAALNGQTVIVFLQADAFSFLYYSGGVYNDPLCGANLDHAVVAVGYGTDTKTSKPYWKVRNHWTQFWGEGGYIRIQRVGGQGICGITLISSMYPIVPAPTNPCLTKPCGAGTCTVTVAPSYTCKCLSPYVSTRDSSPTCALLDYCGSKVVNPCGSGVCKNDGFGSYACTCNAGQGYLLGSNAQGLPTCVTGGDGSGLKTYVVQPGDFCFKIFRQNGITSAQFASLNPAADCNNLISGQILVVGGSVGGASCTKYYTLQVGDYCDQIAINFQTTVAKLLQLNSGFTCDALIPGRQICVQNTVVAAVNPRRCGGTYTTKAGDTCASIQKTFNVNATMFATLNPGLQCAKLTTGLQVCAQGYKTFQAVACQYYDYVREGDSCWSLRTLYGLTEKLFLSLNPGIVCSRLVIGMKVCLVP